MLRDVGHWHARDADGELAVAEKAQELYKFLKQHRVTTADPYGALLEREVPALADGPLYRLVHDDLGEFWHPLWFADFAAHAGRHGLGYVGEADLYGLRTGDAARRRRARALAARRRRPDRVREPQRPDDRRHFRQSLFGHADKPADVDPAPERTARLHWAVRPSAEPLEVGLVSDVFAVLDERRPRTLSFAELQERLGADPAALGEALLDGFRRERLIPHGGPLGIASEPGERPRVSSLARWQAARGPDITSLVYTTVRMEEPAARLLITLLDGTRDRAAIRAELRERAGLDLSEADLDNNLVELTRLFLMEP